jgi:hypothetical protein
MALTYLYEVGHYPQAVKACLTHPPHMMMMSQEFILNIFAPANNHVATTNPSRTYSTL